MNREVGISRAGPVGSQRPDHWVDMIIMLPGVCTGVSRGAEASGEWLDDVGVPAKSGIGGGLVASAPGTCGFGAFSPLPDDHGNRVQGQLAAVPRPGSTAP